MTNLLKDSQTSLETFQNRTLFLKNLFNNFQTPQEKYNYLIDLGKEMPQLQSCEKNESFLVKGCQSQLYLTASVSEDRLSFRASCDSLISAGLAALLISIYNDLHPDIILTQPPEFLSSLGIFASLSPNRAHGLAYIYLKMRSYADLLNSRTNI